MGELVATRYFGEKYDQSSAAIIPFDERLGAAIWSFLSSPVYRESVRDVDQALKVTNATLVKVPFDLAHWQQVAAEKYPGTAHAKGNQMAG